MGRVPFFGGIDLCKLGVEHDKYGIKTDERMATNVPGIWAIATWGGRTYLAPVASTRAWWRSRTSLDTRPRLTTRSSGLRILDSRMCIGWSQGTRGQGKRLQREGIQVPFSANGRAMAIGET
jgi:dihydrolipoamide dehydrogenase